MARREPRDRKHAVEEERLVELGRQVYGAAVDQAVDEIITELKLNGECDLDEHQFIEVLQLAVAKGISIGAASKEQGAAQ